MIKPIPVDPTPKHVNPNPAPPPPKVTEAPKKVDNSRFEGAVTQAKGNATPPIKLNISQPAPPVIEPKEKGVNLNKIL